MISYFKGSHVRTVELLLIAITLLLRVAAFPHSDEIRDIDETGYLEGSLAIFEGLPAGNKAAPAGPNLWVGWLYTGGLSAWHFVHPGTEEKAVPISVRPFVAVNHALFDEYRDLTTLHELWIITQFILATLATGAAFRLGCARGGLTGGILLGGFLAVLPLYVSFTNMSRPYMTSWAFGVLSLHAAVCRQSGNRIVPAGIFLGLAIASRVEMLLLAPMVLWEFWYRAEPRKLRAVCMRLAITTAMAALLAAPWLITHLIGNLRTIATVRLAPNPYGPTTLSWWGVELAFGQGLAGAMLAFLGMFAALVLPAQQIQADGEALTRIARLQVAVLGIYVTILLASLGHGTAFLHQQGPIVLSLIAFGSFGAGQLNRRLPVAAPWVVGALLVIPFIQSIRLIHDIHASYAPDPSTAWVEANIPPGTRVYLQTSLRNLLPTPAAADALWKEVTDDQAWKLKFNSGLQRFGLSTDQLPRALSEENLVQERGNRRGIFILGGRPGVTLPRFDIRYFDASPVFGVHDIVSTLAATGGVVIVRGAPHPELGTPVAKWVGRAGMGTFVYRSIRN